MKLFYSVKLDHYFLPQGNYITQLKQLLQSTDSCTSVQNENGCSNGFESSEEMSQEYTHQNGIHTANGSKASGDNVELSCADDDQPMDMEDSDSGEGSSVADCNEKSSQANGHQSMDSDTAYSSGEAGSSKEESQCLQSEQTGKEGDL